MEVEGHEFTSTIRGAVPVGDRQSRMMELRLQADADSLFIGEAVTVALAESDPRPMLSVPRDALVLRNRETYVYTVTEDEIAVRVPVTTRAGSGERIAVTGDISAGTTVVIRGAERLREGQKVRVIRRSVASN